VSRKHNVKKERSASKYKERLAARGLGKAPTMPAVERLRSKQEDKHEANVRAVRESNELFRKPHASKHSVRKTEETRRGR
jgi:hypothetical protein